MTGTIGEQAKEASAINKSLANLADVFEGLRTNGAYVPFRNSKLTYYLQV